MVTGPTPQQTIQDTQYQFPYHYIPTLENGNFSQVRKLRWGYEYLSYLRFVLSTLEEIQFESVLDVGCGEGRFLWEVSKCFSDKRLVGIDLYARAGQYAKLLNPENESLSGDIAEGDSGDEKVDVITLFEPLEHVPPDRIAGLVAALRRLLKTDGTLLVSVPSQNLGLNRKHYQHFSSSSLPATLRPSFEITQHYFLNRISKWDSLLKLVL